MRYSPVALGALPGWRDDHLAAALTALLASCTVLLAAPASQPIGGAGEAAVRGGLAGQWAGVCHDAGALPAGDEGAARAFLARDLQAWEISQGAQDQALFTGYFEPELAGSRSPGGDFQTPIYRCPGNLAPMFDRAQIGAGALARRGLELAWLADPVDAFFLQVQGSGRIALPDGQVMRVGYAGKNGRPYVAIGGVLAARGDLPLERVSVPSIRGWLAAHPAAAPDLLNENSSYVFFREMTGLLPEEGPPGALGVSLTPGRSVAVDRRFIPLGAPVWVDTTDPIDGGRFQRLMQAQDIGTAIIGPLRGDLFYGWGADAAARAGRARQMGSLFVLLPKVAAPSF